MSAAGAYRRRVVFTRIAVYTDPEPLDVTVRLERATSASTPQEAAPGLAAQVRDYVMVHLALVDPAHPTVHADPNVVDGHVVLHTDQVVAEFTVCPPAG